MAEQQGLVHIYYGDGKGKTTAAFGLAFRCAGWGKLAVIAQFLKSSPCGEVTAAERFPELTVLRSKGIHKFTFQMDEAEKAATASSTINSTTLMDAPPSSSRPWSWPRRGRPACWCWMR